MIIIHDPPQGKADWLVIADASSISNPSFDVVDPETIGETYILSFS